METNGGFLAKSYADDGVVEADNYLGDCEPSNMQSAEADLEWRGGD